MRNKTIAVIADKRTGAIKSIETEIIIPAKEIEAQMKWECMQAIKKKHKQKDIQNY